MSKYWIYQVFGWLAYSAIGITINLLGGSPLGPLLIGHLLLITSSIGLTHLFDGKSENGAQPSTSQ